MNNCFLLGKVRDQDCNPIKQMHIQAKSSAGIELGRATTSVDGFFKIEIPVESIKNINHMTITLSKANKNFDISLEEVLDTRYYNKRLRDIVKEKWENEYDIREIELQLMLYANDNGKHKAVLHPKDIYAENHERIKRFLRDVEETIDLEFSINLDHLRMDGLTKEVEDWILEFIEGHLERKQKFLEFWSILTSLSDAYVRLQLAGEAQQWGSVLCDYDGSQVPRYASSKSHWDVIIWPREEISEEET